MTDLSGSKGVQTGHHGIQLNIFANAGRERLRRYGTPPRLADSFQPRLGLREVIAAGLTSGGAVLSPVVAAGNGGVGKSQLAAAVFHESNADFAVWISAIARSPIVTGYAGAATELDPTCAHLAPDQAAERFLAWLSGTTQTWLVVLDDVADPADVQGLWPQGPAGAVLVTSRRRDLRIGHQVDVGVFTLQESVAYLTERLSTVDQRADVLDGATELAVELGHLPVALSQAAAVVDFDGISCAEYRAQHDLSLLRPTDDYDHPVARTWKAAIERADRIAPVGMASTALELAAVLDPNGIPQEVWIEGGDDMRRGLRNLHALHLVTHDPNGGPTSVRIHALVQQAVLHTIGDVAAVVHRAADRLVAIWPDIEKDRSISQSLRANTDALLAHPGLWQGEAHPVLIRAGKSRGEAGLVDDAVQYFTNLSRVATEVLGPDHSDTLAFRHALADWWGNSGDPAGAAGALERLLPDQLRVLGPDHRDSLLTRHNIAFWRGRAGETEAAISAFEELLLDRLRIFGPDDPLTLAARHNIALWRARVGGNVATALQDLLSDELRILGEDHPYVFFTRHNIAQQLGRAGDPAGAVDALVAVLADETRILGHDHPWVLTTRHSLAQWRGKVAGPRAAIDALEALLADRTRVLGQGHPDTATTRQALEEWRARQDRP